MEAPAEVLRLVETFDRNIETYKGTNYNETQVRREFIDPFFIALGWDVNNTEGYAEVYKDVIHEDSIRIGGVLKAPDYCFRIGGTRKFFVEAKNPSINIKGDPNPAFQLRRYAWSAKLPLSILTDFEEFAVYDCRIRPSKNDLASKARVIYYKYTEFSDRWDEISDIFSHDAILKGSFDKYAQTKRKQGTAEVDSAFLVEIERWREILAKNIALRNSNLTNRQLNFAVQKTIDRIIFLRIAEDRGLERYGELLSLHNGKDVYERLLTLFRKADDRYNSGLFHFQKEKDRTEDHDELTTSLTLDDKVLKDIVKTLYYPDSPYEFSVLPAEILGYVYEQFLGKVITLTSGHRAKIEEKPEVKKAGGVYYTPSYIVDYIVENTVGKLLESRTIKYFKTKPPQMDPPLTICDPACGSGSFLIGAYQYLLDWYLKYYTENDTDQWLKSANPTITETTTAPASTGTNYKLTVAERKRIILDHIYGVDIDSQAVEVTKLSLLLKVLEGEKAQMLFATKRALPDLAQNIKCGNSLIAHDFYKNQQTLMFDEEQKYKINTFDWEEEFPNIFNKKSPGFDAVIGNPPYVQASLILDYKKYFQSHYIVYSATSDLYIFFIEQSFRLLAKTGLYSMIVSNKWIRADYGYNLRTFFSNNVALLQLLDFGELPVFPNIGTFPCIILGSHKQKSKNVLLYAMIKSLPPTNMIEHELTNSAFNIPISSLDPCSWTLAPPNINALLRKADLYGVPLGKVSNLQIRRGVLTGFNPAFIIDEETKQKLICEDPSARELIKPFVSGSEVRRYTISWKGRYLIFTHRGIDISQYPSIFKHLSAWRRQLQPKKTRHDKIGRKPGQYAWYEIQDVTNYYPEFDKPKLVYGQFQIAPHFTFSSSTLYLGSNHYMICHEQSNFLLYLCGILNSKLYFFYMKYIAGVLGDADKRGRLITQKSHMLKYPIRVPNFSDPKDKANHNKMVSLVESMLDLNKKLPQAKTTHEKTILQRQIASTDDQIDQLVYELYNLTEEEIKIIEESTK